MLGFLQATLAPCYIYIKFVHVVAVFGWLLTATCAYAFYLVPVMKAWRRHPDDPEIIPVRNWVLERFDEVVTYEHTFFPIVLITGPMMYIAGGWHTGVAWLALKLLIVIGLFIPIEIIDYHLSHFGGNKRKIRARGDMALYERAVHRHWWFLLITSPAMVTFGILSVFLAIAKPNLGA